MRLVAALLVCSLAHAAPTAITDARAVKSEGAAARPISLEQLFAARNIGRGSWSPDGKQIVFVSNLSGRNNLWLLPSSGGFPAQLTVSEQRQVEPSWSPDGKWIAFVSDKDGDEQWDLFVVSPENGEVVNLTSTPEVAEDEPSWSPDGKWLAFTRKPKTASAAEVNVMELATRKVRALTSGTPAALTNTQLVWSPEGRRLVFSRPDHGEKHSDLYSVELAGGAPRKIPLPPGERTFYSRDVAADGTIAAISNAKGLVQPVLVDPKSGALTWIGDGQSEGYADVFTPDGKSLIWGRNADGESTMMRWDRASGRSTELALPAGTNHMGGWHALSRDGTRLLIAHQAGDQPNDLWSYALADGRATQLTHALPGRVGGLVRPQRVRYQSADGKFPITAWLWVPHGLTRPAPAVVYIHGGPSAQIVDQWEPGIEYLANQGFVVIAPNYRGSTGYGKAFEDANQMDMGGGDLSDIVAAAAWLRKVPLVDGKRIGVMGRSYGGYMTMMALTKAPKEWAAGVAIVPFVNYFTEVLNEDPALAEYDRQTMGDPVKNKALWEDRSPINFIDKIIAPVMLQAGGHDPRCPASESRQVYDAIKKRGGVIELKVWEDEGHQFGRLENRIDSMRRAVEFLKKHVSR
jgi:dipeptidyl aminopeptidase/acylaminoacyl peptidase